jgi:hypothetical protein
MTWQVVFTVAAIFAVITPFGLLGGWWLSYMAQRTYAIWPVFVAIVAAFVFGIGVTAVVAAVAV